MIDTFLQDPPRLGNQYRDDRVLREHLARVLPPEVLRDVEPELDDLGELAGGRLYEMQLDDRENEPALTRYDAWGRRVDRITVTPLWREAERLAAERGLVATAYERRHGRYSRLHQFALAHLFTPATDIYSCPLAMTDGAVRTLLAAGNPALVERAVPHLTSRDPATFWTSGQWMTETTGGSDVGTSETVAVEQADGSWRLHGRKWFTSAAASQMALTLARPEGNGPGGKGLALFYVECRDAAGELRNIRIERLKDKLGTRKLPTAELDLDGTPATLVAGRGDGVRNIVPMLALTRTWNGVSAVSYMRRGLALARDYARRRVAFGAPLADKPLHLDTLAGLQAEMEGAFQLVFRVVDLLGRSECGRARRRRRPPAAPAHPGDEADHRPPGGGGDQRGGRGLRRRRLRGGHGHPGVAARRPGAVHLGGDDERPRPRRAARPRPRRRAGGDAGRGRGGGAAGGRRTGAATGATTGWPGRRGRPSTASTRRCAGSARRRRAAPMRWRPAPAASPSPSAARSSSPSSSSRPAGRSPNATTAAPPRRRDVSP